MSGGNIVPISIAPLGLIEKVAHDAQTGTITQQAAAQQQAVEDIHREQKQVQKPTKGDDISKVGDEQEEERRQKRRSGQRKSKRKEVQAKPDSPNRPWAGHLLDVKI
ncbi:MAG: hypothetical protein IJD04_08175 [Desulfovibrionaceae bacterium]|nr:hypothetical protein [Desulfovibrionaceae bacterium]